LSGLVERVTYHNTENGFWVLRVKARGQRGLIALVGHAAAINVGKFISAAELWITDREHGLQFKAAQVTTTQPTTLEGIEKYLGSGMIRGIGPTYARALVQASNEAVFDLIEQEPVPLRKVTGIGAKQAQCIVAGWAEQKAIREIMLFLHANGVGTSWAVRIFKTYGQQAIALITENPYRLAHDIRGIGFRTADLVAAKLGIAKTAMIRVKPTSRAARRLTESTGLEARTIHRLLEADPKTGGFKRGEARPLDCGLLVVDECSMVDVPLMRSLLQALPDQAALLLDGHNEIATAAPTQASLRRDRRWC